ncbi:MAG: Fe-S-containing hydro-lyase [Syntrophomonadaceae bacterium]|jgi:fumarate hydratase subunit beta
MKNIKEIKTPLQAKDIDDLQAGDQVTITGVIYACRDAAHKIMVNALKQGESLPVDLKDQVVYYVGPCPAPPGKVIGSCGPTTSGRMDSYAPVLIEQGLRGMIGKGPRSQEVIEAMKKYKAVYFAAIGGAGATIANSVKQAEIVAYHELGPEALYRLEVEKFPCIVAIDSQGNDLYRIGREKYCISK